MMDIFSQLCFLLASYQLQAFSFAKNYHAFMMRLQYKKVLGSDGKPLPEDNWVWAPTGVIDIHRPQYWGFLFFTENGEEYLIPEDERLRFDLYRLFEEQRAYYREHGRYSTDVDALCAAAGVEKRPVIETTAHFFEMRVKRTEGRGEIRLFADGRSEMT